MIKPTKTKAEIRAEMEAEMARYLNKGGDVKKVDSGVSANTDNRNLFANTTAFEPKQGRTDVQDVVQTLEDRKKSCDKPKALNRRRRKRLIKDDFGEPIRWVWDD